MVNVTASVLNELQVEETANGKSIEEPTDQADTHPAFLRLLVNNPFVCAEGSHMVHIAVALIAIRVPTCCAHAAPRPALALHAIHLTGVELVFLELGERPLVVGHRLIRLLVVVFVVVHLTIATGQNKIWK